MMRREMIRFALCACLTAVVVGLPSPLRADTLYSQPWDGTGNGYASQNDTNGGGFGNFATTYDNFTLGSAATVTGVSWVGEYSDNTGPSTSFTVDFYANASGLPGAMLSTETIALSQAHQTLLGNAGGFAVFSYSATLSSPFSAVAGTEYWLSVVSNMGFPPQWYWVTGTGGTAAPHSSSSPATRSWGRFPLTWPSG